MLQQHTLQTTAYADVERVVREHLSAFGRGDFHGWGATLAPDVFFTAADPEEVFLRREEAIAEMHKDFDMAFDEGLQIEIEPPSFQAGAASNRKAAWTAAPLQYGISFQGERNSFVLRHTSVLTESDQGWSILATHYSLALSKERVLQALTMGILPAPQSFGYAVGTGAQGLVEEFKRFLLDFSAAATRRDAQVFGPFPEDQAEGESAVRALFADWRSSLGPLRLRPEGVRAELVSDEMGWVGANVEAVLSYQDKQVSLPLRALVLYQKDRDSWAIAHLHLSVGIPDELAE